MQNLRTQDQLFRATLPFGLFRDYFSAPQQNAVRQNTNTWGTPDLRQQNTGGRKRRMSRSRVQIQRTGMV